RVGLVPPLRCGRPLRGGRALVEPELTFPTYMRIGLQSTMCFMSHLHAFELNLAHVARCSTAFPRSYNMLLCRMCSPLPVHLFLAKRLMFFRSLWATCGLWFREVFCTDNAPALPL
ncbi:unnamed protein product, partial [Ectocarpus sp. 12 AP-2014]